MPASAFAHCLHACRGHIVDCTSCTRRCTLIHHWREVHLFPCVCQYHVHITCTTDGKSCNAEQGASDCSDPLIISMIRMTTVILSLFPQSPEAVKRGEEGRELHPLPNNTSGGTARAHPHTAVAGCRRRTRAAHSPLPTPLAHLTAGHGQLHKGARRGARTGNKWVATAEAVG
jgi:hypothetical protein